VVRYRNHGEHCADGRGRRARARSARLAGDEARIDVDVDALRELQRDEREARVGDIVRLSRCSHCTLHDQINIAPDIQATRDSTFSRHSQVVLEVVLVLDGQIKS
jgi:hypothetical protein